MFVFIQHEFIVLQMHFLPFALQSVSPLFSQSKYQEELSENRRKENILRNSYRFRAEAWNVVRCEKWISNRVGGVLSQHRRIIAVSKWE